MVNVNSFREQKGATTSCIDFSRLSGAFGPDFENIMNFTDYSAD
jgi:hypothetical protein